MAGKERTDDVPTRLVGLQLCGVRSCLCPSKQAFARSTPHKSLRHINTHVGRCIRSVGVMQNVFHGPVGCCFGAPIGPESLRQSRDGQWVAWCAQHDICLLNWKTGRLDKVRFNEPESERLLELSPAGRWLVVTDRADEKQQSVVIDVQSSRVIRRFSSPVRTFVKEDRFALVWIDEERLELTDMVSGDVLGSFSCQGDLVASPDGNWLVFGHWPEQPEHDKKIVIWDIRGQPKQLDGHGSSTAPPDWCSLRKAVISRSYHGTAAACA